MAPRNNELPEGTDHIVNGAMETGTGSAGTATGGGGGTGSGFIGAGAGDGTGGTAAKGGTMATNTTGTGTTGTGTTGTSSGTTDAGGGTLGSGTRSTSSDGGGTIGSGTRSSSDGGGVVDQLRNQATQLRDQAGDRARGFAESGKTRASDALEELSRTIGETADSIDERLGSEYGEYARRAADTVSGVADTLRRQDVDALYENVRSAVRKSPGVAIGVAAVLGFTVARLIKAGLPGDDEGRSGTRTNTGTGGGTGGSTGSTGTGGTATGGSTGTGGTTSTRS